MVDWVGSDTLPAALAPDEPREAQPRRVQVTGDIKPNIPVLVTPESTRQSNDVPPQADILYGKVRQAEGTHGGSGYVYYGGKEFKPGKDFPEWEGAQGPQGKTHAAGPGQWQPDTWNGLKPTFQQKFGREPDFSSDADQRRMVWLNAEKTYGPNLAKDIDTGKLDTSKLASQWQGFAPRSQWAATRSGKWNVADQAIAYEQGRSNTNVVWMSPDDYLAMSPEIEKDDQQRSKRQSLLRSVELGEDIEAIPTLDVKPEGGRLKVFDQDGRNRALTAKQEGADLIPVAVHGAGQEAPGWIEGMRGDVRPFNFTPVPKVSRETSGIRGAGGDLAGSERFYSGVRSALENIGQTIQHTLPTGSEGARAGQARLDQAIAQRQADLRSSGQDAWPYAAGEVAGSALPAMAVPIAGATLPARMALGAVGGAVAGAGEPVSDPSRFWSEKIPELAGGAAGGAAGVPVAEGVVRSAGALGNALRSVTGAAQPVGTQVNRFLRNLASLTDSENKARDILSRRFAEDAAVGGPTAKEADERMARARAEGLPMTLADVGGENVRAAVGSAGRQGGPARGRLAQWAVGRLGDVERDSPLLTNIEQGIDKYLATGSARTEARALAEQRSQAAPLWQKAMDGGNLVPVDRALAQEYGAASRAAEQASSAAEKESTKLAEMERRAVDQDVRVPKAPTRLNSFLVREGGLQDQSGEIAHTIGGAKGRPALINNASGLSLDEAALRAWQEGYLEGAERPTTADLLDAIAQDHNVGPIYSSKDDEAALAHHDAKESNTAADQRRTKRPLPPGEKVSADQLQFQRDKVGDLKAQQARANEDRALYAETIKRGQEDGTIGLKGAVWSPRLNRLLQNPKVKAGINRGYAIERDIADGEGKPFRPRDYAVVGEDADGHPQVGAVPNMKLLAVAKEGLDATLESEAMRDPLTGRLNKAGRAVKILRDGLVDELDRLNPEYKVARDQWAGDSALISAVRDGKGFHKSSPEEIEEWFAKAGDSEKQAYRIGAADTLRDDISRAALGGDPSKRLINSPRLRRQILPMFRSVEDADKFLSRVQDARTMAQTPSDLLRGSPTAARMAEDMANRGGLEGASAALAALHGAVTGHPGSVLASLARGGRAFMNTPDVTQLNNALVRLALDPRLRLSSAGNILTRFPLPKVQNALAQGAARGGAPLAAGVAGYQMGQGQ